VFNAFQSNLVFFYSPTQVGANEGPVGPHLPPRRPGARKAASSATACNVSFVVTDTAKTVPVRYSGILPDLFKEGKGVVAQGKLEGGVFVAREVLAKHDENYMPPEAADALQKAHQAQSMSQGTLVQGGSMGAGAAMIPELGTLRCGWRWPWPWCMGVVPIVGQLQGPRRTGWRWRGRMAWCCSCWWRGLCLPHRSLRRQRLLGAVRGAHSNSGLPLMYRVAGVWGGHEGSLLLWAMMLVVWMLAVAAVQPHLPLPMVARILGVMGLVSVGFLLFTLITSNPFDRLFPVPADGRDLNPLLQDPGMIIHPPMLYMGYVGFSVAFAFAVAALLGGKLDADLGALDPPLDHPWPGCS
jgi:cytochrome c-type biogenesis protein CcmE